MPTRYPGTPGETAALDAYIKLMRAAEAVTARVGGVMAAAGLTIGQFGVLEALLHHGPLCQRDLGHKLLRSDGNTAGGVGNLVRRGPVAPQRLDGAELEALGGFCRRLGLGDEAPAARNGSGSRKTSRGWGAVVGDGPHQG